MVFDDYRFVIDLIACLSSLTEEFGAFVKLVRAPRMLRLLRVVRLLRLLKLAHLRTKFATTLSRNNGNVMKILKTHKISV